MAPPRSFGTLPPYFPDLVVRTAFSGTDPVGLALHQGPPDAFLRAVAARYRPRLRPPRRSAAPARPNLRGQAEQLVSAVFAPSERFLRGQLAATQEEAQRRAEFMRQVFSGFAEFLKTMVPEVQAIYQRAAGAVSNFSRGYAAGLSAVEQKTAQDVQNVLSTIGAPPGTAPPSLGAGERLYALTGYLPAATLTQQGAAYASYAAGLPSVFLQAGANEIARMLQRFSERETEIRGRLAELQTQRAQAILEELHRLRDEQARRRAETRAEKRDRFGRVLTMFQNNLLTWRQAARMLGIPGWQKLPAATLLDLRRIDQQQSQRFSQILALRDRGLITDQTAGRLLNVPNWQSLSNQLPNGVQYRTVVVTTPAGDLGVLSIPTNQPATAENTLFTIVQQKPKPKGPSVDVKNVHVQLSQATGYVVVRKPNGALVFATDSDGDYIPWRGPKPSDAPTIGYDDIDWERTNSPANLKGPRIVWLKNGKPLVVDGRIVRTGGLRQPSKPKPNWHEDYAKAQRAAVDAISDLKSRYQPEGSIVVAPLPRGFYRLAYRAALAALRSYLSKYRQVIHVAGRPVVIYYRGTPPDYRDAVTEATLDRLVRDLLEQAGIEPPSKKR